MPMPMPEPKPEPKPEPEPEPKPKPKPEPEPEPDRNPNPNQVRNPLNGVVGSLRLAAPLLCQLSGRRNPYSNPSSPYP